MPLIHLISAARPNMMKIAPLYHALAKSQRYTPHIIHSGQHYDTSMYETFLSDLGLTNPTHCLEVGSGTHAEQTGRAMIAYEQYLRDHRPDLVVVVGDVNSTLACSLASVKLGIKVAHLEAGLRCFDRHMPEEINRVLTDHIADYLWSPSPDAVQHLVDEGLSQDKIEFVGNIMIDSLCMMLPKITQDPIFSHLNLTDRGYGVVTLHRPFNVDDHKTLERIVTTLVSLSAELPLIFPIHPRTQKQLDLFGLSKLFTQAPNITCLAPLGYSAFMKLVLHAKLLISDSGGIQEESSYLGIPCFTLRPTTERPITLSEGSNQLVRIDTLQEAISATPYSKTRQPSAIEKWDGKTAERIVRLLDTMFF